MFRCFGFGSSFKTVPGRPRDVSTSSGNLEAVKFTPGASYGKIQCATPKPSLRNAGGLYWITGDFWLFSGDFWFLGSIRHINGGFFESLNPYMASVGLKSYPDGERGDAWGWFR